MHKQCLEIVCNGSVLLKHPAIVSDAGYELNRSTGPEERDTTVESKVSGTENEIEAHKELNVAQKQHSGPREEYRCSNQIYVWRVRH